MTNPFEDNGRPYYALQNAEGQYSLWPEFVAIPEGWNHQHGPDAKDACLAFIEQRWTDMRPNSLVAGMGRVRNGMKKES
jgi:MbtH protein